MKKIYDDEFELFSDLEGDLADAMQGNIDKRVKSIYKNKAEASYRDYTPKTNNSRYRNGMSGSFADEDNFKEEVIWDKDVLTYTLENHREADCDCFYCRSKKVRIAGYVEDGIAGKSRIKAKLVYEKTQEEIDNVIQDIIMNELSKKDWL